MQPLPRTTPATTDVLRALLDEPGPTWGLRLVKSTGRPTGTVYPILERLQAAGWVISSWEDDQERPGPRRRLYSLTTDGAAAARSVVASAAAQRAGVRAGLPRLGTT